jgi:hypothetical protein
MEPTLIVFGIKSLVRCFGTGKKAAEQLVRDRNAVFPELIKIDMSKKGRSNATYQREVVCPRCLPSKGKAVSAAK